MLKVLGAVLIAAAVAALVVDLLDIVDVDALLGFNRSFLSLPALLLGSLLMSWNGSADDAS